MDSCAVLGIVGRQNSHKTAQRLRICRALEAAYGAQTRAQARLRSYAEQQCKIKVQGEPHLLELCLYQNGRLALRLHPLRNVGHLALSVNLPDEPLGPHRFFALEYSCAFAVAAIAELEQRGWIGDTGQRACSGYVRGIRELELRSPLLRRLHDVRRQRMRGELGFAD